jgi:threonine aldolase
VGSAIVGEAEAIERARRHRKVMGGGMRQSGVLAAAALYALEHNLDRLAEDHANAQALAAAVRETPGLSLDPPQVDTNIVIFRIDERLGTAADLNNRLREQGVHMLAFAKHKIRAVTHHDVTASDVARAADVLRRVAR